MAKQIDNDSDMDDDDRHDAELELMKKHAEQRIAIMQGEQIEIEDEMESVSSYQYPKYDLDKTYFKRDIRLLLTVCIGTLVLYQ